MISFAAVFQFAPPSLAGFFCGKENEAGALLGLGGGVFLLGSTLCCFLPSSEAAGCPTLSSRVALGVSASESRTAFEYHRWIHSLTLFSGL